MGYQDFLESLRLQWTQLVHTYRNYWRKTPLEEYGQEEELLEMVRIGRRGLQMGYMGVSEGGDGSESQGILWIILVLIQIGVVIWVLSILVIALGTWWAGLFRRDDVEDWEEGKGEV